MNENNKDMFDFPSISAADWGAAIKKELKGADISTIRKEIEPGIIIEPFYIQDEFPGEVIEMKPSEETVAIGEVFDLDMSGSIEQLKVSLAGGCDSPEFHFSRVDQLEEVFEFLNLSYVFSSYHADLGNSEELINLISKTQGDARGAILIPYNFDEEFWDIRSMCLKKLPNFKFGHIFHEYNDNRSEQIFMLASIFESYLHDGLVKGIELKDLVQSVVIEWRIGNDFLIECASLRAFQTVMGNILHNMDYTDERLPYIQVRTAESSLISESHLNMIRLTTQAVVANYARVDRILLAPGEVELNKVKNFDRRISRNIQHLLTMESNIDKRFDALSGSYFFEMLSAELSEKVWERLDWKEN